MKKLVVLIGLVSLVFSSGAMAQIDPDDDMLGIYFDVNAIVFCTDALVGAPFPAYLCLTNPTYVGADGEAVSGWEVNVEVTPGVFILAWNLTAGAVNVSLPPDFIVGLATPLPWSPVIVLMDMQVGVFAADPIEFILHPAEQSSFDPPSPGYAAGDNPGLLIPLGYSAGGEVVCAVINGDCNVTADEDATWGSVKNMYK